MTENTVEAVPEWNPLATTEPETHPLKASGGRATVLLAPWTGRERLAYEDALTERMLTEDENGETTVRMGTLRLFAISLTIKGSTGFGVDGFLSGDRAKVEADLLSITDAKTFEEIRDLALKVQPLPSQDNSSDDDEDAGEDPSETSSTQATPTGDVDE